MVTPRKVWRLARNLVALRGELLEWAAGAYLNRKASKSKPVAVTCIRCGHELTKPCKPGSPAHVFRWPEGPPGKVGNEIVHPGELVYVRRQKPRGGQIRPDYEMRTKPF